MQHSTQSNAVCRWRITCKSRGLQVDFTGTAAGVENLLEEEMCAAGVKRISAAVVNRSLNSHHRVAISSETGAKWASNY